ncbi:MAG: metallophosphoesterase [archaeon]
MFEFVGKCLLVEEQDRKILVIGDLHLGFEEAMNKTGVFVSRKMFGEMINYLDGVFKKIGDVDEVVLLGDVKHVFGSVMGQEWSDVLGLFDYLEDKCKKIIVIKGNHDKIIEPIAKKRDILVKDYYVVGSFCFLHGDRDFIENYDKNVVFWVVGHGHPAIKISDDVKVEKFKAFMVGKYKKKNVILVPSFFDYNLGGDPRENDLGYIWNFDLDRFGIWIVQDESFGVLNFGKLKDLR